MKVHNISFDSFQQKGGVTKEVRDNILYMTTTHTIKPECRLGKLPINSYIYLPDRYKLPLRIDITLKIDSPELYLMLGKGHINFGTMWSNNRRIEDLVEPVFKVRFFENSIPMNEFVDISVLYTEKAM